MRSDAFGDNMAMQWMDEAQRRIIQATGCLRDGVALTAINNGAGYAQGATSIVVDDSTYLKVGDRIDIIDADEAAATRKQSMGNTISAITRSSHTLTVSALDNACDDNDDVYFHHDFGLIDSVADQSNYDLPWNCLSIRDVWYKTGANNNYYPLRQSDDRNAAVSVGIRYAASGSGYQSGSPEFWYSHGAGGASDFYILPAPTAAVVDAIWVRFNRRPLPLLSPEQEPAIDETYHMALAHWVAYMSLSAPGNDPNTAVQQLQLFQSYIGLASEAVDYNPRADGMRGDQP